MKLIEKTCPNCGANLKFNKDDEKIVCEYCKKEYLVEKEDEGDDYYLVSSDIGKAVIKGTFFTVFIIAFILILVVAGIIFGSKAINGMIKANEEITSIEKISSSREKEIHNKSVDVINSFTILNLGVTRKENFKNMGMYFMKDKDGNTLFDVYKAVYTTNEGDRDVWVAVKYDNIANNNSFITGKFIGEFKQVDFKYLLGYESCEELYNYITSTYSYDKITATKDLFVK